MNETPSYCLTDTIYALSSGMGKGGVAVIRISGSNSLSLLKNLTGLENPIPRYAYFRTLRDSEKNVLDHALCLYFKAPHSFTGEDVVELQVHGGRSVINRIFSVLSTFPSCRPAERGEFSRRAVINGKMDLTEAEGLMDFIDAQTEQQRRQALFQMEGNLGRLYEKWRRNLMHHMAYLEAFIDFPEEDIPPEKYLQINHDIENLISQIQTHLNDQHKGQRLRDGFQIALVGKPNAGKSSLINALSQKEVAIVSQTAGTTRDVVEVHLDVDGFPVILADTAGLREAHEEIEAEGIRRAVKKAKEADLILLVRDLTDPSESDTVPADLKNESVISIWNKSDLYQGLPKNGLALSAKTGEGLDTLWDLIKQKLQETFSFKSEGVITRERYRVALKECLFSLQDSLKTEELELKAEDLRLAARALGRITGRIETDDLLDIIFRDFCIGK